MARIYRAKPGTSGSRRHLLEHQEQRIVVTKVRALGWPCAAVPNAGKRGPKAQAQVKAEGIASGYPDLVIDRAIAPYHGLRIEMKRERAAYGKTDSSWDRQVDPLQRQWIDTLREEGYAAVVCFGYAEAIHVWNLYRAGVLRQPAWYYFPVEFFVGIIV